MATSDVVGTSGDDRPGDVLVEAPTATPEAAPQATGRHLDGLDGIRALAVAAVVLYHLDPAWLPGGFLGVDVFFVVSGFLITTLLQREAVEYGRIRLQRFWVRRTRRLVPALVVCVLASTLLARAVHHDLVVGIGRQLFGALTFSTNWVEIVAGSSYFDRTSPLLFMNFWSLAVEEQFYLVWPLAVGLIVAAAAATPSRLRRHLGLVVSMAAAIVSAGLMAALYTPGEDATRVYYGLDTHAMGLMLGAALAFAWASPGRSRLGQTWVRVRRPALAAAGALLAVLLWVLREDSSWPYRGGILLASALTAILVAGLLPVEGEPSSRWRAAMSAEPLLWIGRRSYGIYLWHWPVIVIIDQQMRTDPGSLQYLVSRIWMVLVTVAIADLSYRFVEAPIRVWGFRGCAAMAWSHLHSPVATWSRVAAIAGVSALVLAAGVVVTAPALSDTAKVLAQNSTDAPATTGSPPDGPAQPSAAATTTPPTATAPPVAAVASPPQDWSMPSGNEIDVFGDSLVVVTKGAIDYYFPDVRQDAKSNRQWTDGRDEVTARGADIRRAVVLAFGTNAGVSDQTVAAVLDKLGPNRMVVLVNLYGRAGWIDEANRRLAAAASARSNVIVADWNSAIKGHLDLLQSDGIHPGITGAHLFAKTIRQALADLSTRHTGQPVTLKELPVY